MSLSFPGVFPKHQFVLLGWVADNSIDVIVHPRPFTIPAFAQGVFDDLLARRMAGKQIHPGGGNILHVESVTIGDRENVLVAARRCDYAAYLGLTLSASQEIPGGSLIQRYGRDLHEVWESGSWRSVSFPPFGCTLGLTGICISSDDFLITKKKSFGDTATATDHGRRLHLGASQIRFDCPDGCYSLNKDPLVERQMAHVLADREATPGVVEESLISSFAIGIFTKDHHPELFFEVASRLNHQEILVALQLRPNLEGEIEAISLQDTDRIRRILAGEDEFPFADHHAGGLITWLSQSKLWDRSYEQFLPQSPLPHSFS